MALLLTTTALFLGWLLAERIRLDRARRRVPLRISVTGTRGKSGTARMLGAMLRSEGLRVVVKTTGSEASLVLPDGRVELLPRSGVPSILEQRDLIRRCARLGADVLVAEIMSIHPENHRAEGIRILQPQTVLFTNARPDHVDAMGWDERAVGGVLLASVPQDSQLLLSPSLSPLLRRLAAEHGVGSVHIAGGEEASAGIGAPFRDNACLAAAAARLAGAGEESVRAGLAAWKEDAGGLRAWRLDRLDAAGPIYVVSAFSANDPLSTREAFDHARHRLSEPMPCTGLLTLRSDRADRTLHWIRDLEERGFPGLDPLFAVGTQAGLVARRVPGVRTLQGSDPRTLTRRAGIAGRGQGPRMLFGLGNFKGLGEALASWWAEEGVPLEL